MRPRCSNSWQSPGRDRSDQPPSSWVAITDTSRASAWSPWPVSDCTSTGSRRCPPCAPILTSKDRVSPRPFRITLRHGSWRRGDDRFFMWQRRMKGLAECTKPSGFASAGSLISLSSNRRRNKRRNPSSAGIRGQRVNVGRTVDVTGAVRRLSSEPTAGVYRPFVSRRQSDRRTIPSREGRRIGSGPRDCA